MKFVITLWLLFASLPALACSFCQLGQGLSPYLTSNGEGVSLDVKSIFSNAVYDGTNKTNSLGKQEQWLLYTLNGFYSFSENVSAMISIPYSMKTNVDHDDASGLSTGALVTGLGDIAVTGRFTLLRQHSLESTFVAGVLAGIKFPTGGTGNRDGNGLADRHAMPGTGSYDENLGISLAKTWASGYELTADFVYTLAGIGKWGGLRHRYGNSLNYGFQGFYRLSPRQLNESPRSLFLFTGPSGEIAGKETGTNLDPGLRDDSTGGQTIFWDLGIYSTIDASTMASLSYSKAFYHNMNYNSTFDADPAEDQKIDVSITFLF